MSRPTIALMPLPSSTPSSSDRIPAQQESDPLADSGVVIVDKPAGWTSHDVVGKLRRIFRTRKVGHSGTLDPMATGVLVVGIGRGTKFLNHVHADAKSYAATIRLGASTLTDDAEGEVLSTSDAAAITDEQVAEAIAGFRGDIMQRPANVSAVKIDGVRAYERIRLGEQVEIPERPVHVERFDILEIRRVETDDAGQTDAKQAYVDVDVEVDCSAGTFIRSLARDLGEALGVGGHLTALRRTAAGVFDISAARTIEQLEAEPQFSFTLDQACLHCFPRRNITESEGTDLALGKWLKPIGLRGVHAATTPDERVIALIEESGDRAKSAFVVRPATL